LIVVQKMRVSEAGCTAAATEDPGWGITNRTAVEMMAASAESLRLLLEVLLPDLRLHPTSPSRLSALCLHAAHFRVQAAEVSRSFLAEVINTTDRPLRSLHRGCGGATATQPVWPPVGPDR
jgi:hypothetical protein